MLRRTAAIHLIYINGYKYLLEICVHIYGLLLTSVIVPFHTEPSPKPSCFHYRLCIHHNNTNLSHHSASHPDSKRHSSLFRLETTIYTHNCLSVQAIFPRRHALISVSLHKCVTTFINDSFFGPTSPWHRHTRT